MGTGAITSKFAKTYSRLPGIISSHYRILEKLGAGGMGEVYRAEDTNLDRQVAIKALPDIFSGDPERLARFEREAKLLASLNHPNIAAIYGLEEAAGKRFIVLELVEGETLAQRIARGPLLVDDALEVCRQIAGETVSPAEIFYCGRPGCFCGCIVGRDFGEICPACRKTSVALPAGIAASPCKGTTQIETLGWHSPCVMLG